VPASVQTITLSIHSTYAALFLSVSTASRAFAPVSALSSGFSLSADLITVVSNRVKIVRMIRNLRHSLRALVGAPHAKFREQIGAVRTHSQ
jgi:hypothetical protein